MTEREKMLNGEIYDANYDQSLIRERAKAKEKCVRYNKTAPKQTRKREKLLREIFGNIGQNPIIEPPFYCDYGSLISAGDNFYANHNLVVLDAGKVEIGNNVFIAPNVTLTTSYHPLDAKRRNQGLEYAGKITIEDDVWIGANAVILPNVTIKRGAVVGAGAVVTKDVPANTVTAGIPARVIREIEDNER